MSRVATPSTARPTPHGTPTPPPTNVGVAREKVAMLAYEKWLKSGCKHGYDQLHWLEAEKELQAEMTRPTKR